MARVYFAAQSRQARAQLEVASGVPTAAASTATPAISDDGSRIAFTTHSGRGRRGVDAGEVAAYDRIHKSTTIVAPASERPARSDANRSIAAAAASSDGSRIVFESEADELVRGDTNNVRELFIVDRASGRASRVVAGRRADDADQRSAQEL